MDLTILTSAHPADDKRVFQRHARFMAEKGLRVVLVAPGPEGERVESGVTIVGLGSRRGYRDRLLGLPGISRQALRVGGDIFHLHDPELLPVGVWLRRTTGRPVVYDAHENYRLAALSSRGFPPAVAPVVSTLVDRTEKFLARRMSAVVSPHPARLRELVGESGVPALQVPNSPRRSYGGSLGIAEKAEPAEVVYMGLLSEERGAGLILDAAQRLPDLHFRLHVDFGDPARLVEYQHRVERLGLVNVRAEGYVPYEEVAGILARATVGLLPWLVTPQHLHAAQPTKLFEYMAMGLPIVAADLPITREIVQGSGAGILHTPGDPEALAETIRSLVNAPEERSIMSCSGRKAFQERYNFDAVGQHLLELYDSLAGTAGASPVTG